MTIVPTSYAARAFPFFDLLREAGVMVEDELERAGIPVAFAEQPDQVMPTHIIGQFILEAARRNGIEDIAFLGAQRDTFQTLESSIQARLSAAVTLRDMLERYYRIAQGYVSYRWLRTEAREDTARLISHADDRLAGAEWLRISDWSHVMLLVSLVRHVVGEGFQPDEIGLQSRGGISRVASEAFPETGISDGCETTFISIPRRLMARPLPQSSPRSATATKRLPSEIPDFASHIRHLIRPFLSQPDFGIEQASQVADTSIRSFQRRLAASGTTFSELLAQTRYGVSVDLLAKKDLRVEDVALALGYANSANFTRAFRRHSGMSPREFRKTFRDC